MRSIIAVVAVMISVSAFAPQQVAPQPPRVVAQPADGKSVAKFFLMACLPAVADPASIFLSRI